MHREALATILLIVLCSHPAAAQQAADETAAIEAVKTFWDCLSTGDGAALADCAAERLQLIEATSLTLGAVFHASRQQLIREIDSMEGPEDSDFFGSKITRAEATRGPGQIVLVTYWVRVPPDEPMDNPFGPLWAIVGKFAEDIPPPTPPPPPGDAPPPGNEPGAAQVPPAEAMGEELSWRVTAITIPG